MTHAGPEQSSELTELAFVRIANVLGPERARQLIRRFTTELGFELSTPQDLMRLSEAMTALGGIEAAVGAMLGVAAVVRGAVPSNLSNAARLHPGI